MICGLHQAVPSRFQVVVTVRDIWNRRVRGKRSRCEREVKKGSQTLTSHYCLQSHTTLAFGLATSGDVPEIMLQVPNAAAQLVAGPLIRRGVLCFEGGIGGDVLRHIFGPDDFFRKQIKAERGKEKRR
jgi:hypothetical protein